MEISAVPAAEADLNPRLWRLLVQAIRPATLLAGIGPILVGISLGIQQLHGSSLDFAGVVGAALAALLLVIFLQSAANLVNDAKDAEKGIDTGVRLGPVRLVQSGLLSSTVVKRAYRSLFALAGLLVAILFGIYREPIIPIVAILSAATAYLYTAGPYPLAYYALGEVLACWFFGPIAVMGTVYLITQKVIWMTAFWGLGSGFIAAAIMAINNLRDRHGDRAAGKHTIATLTNEEFARKLPLLLVLGSAMLLAFFGLKSNKVVIAMPWALLAMMFIRRRITPRLVGEGPFLNEALKFTAIFNVFYALLFSSLVLL